MMEIKQYQWPGWETTRIIGKGSFGTVYEIERQVFGEIEKAALKVITIPENTTEIDELRSEGYNDASITAHFHSYLEDIVREYSTMAKLKGHTNVVYCDDVKCIQHDDGIGWDIFIKMELLKPIIKCMDRFSSEKEIVRLGIDICNALALCKERNIVHRDIKPQNIFVSLDGDYKLGDFGIAKIAERTTSGTKVGTYKYMAPEVYKCEPYGVLADQYSLGMVLYWLLNEKRTPFLPLPPQIPTTKMEEKARLRRIMGEPLPPPVSGNQELQQIVLKACAYQPQARYASIREMMTDLQNYNAREWGTERAEDSWPEKPSYLSQDDRCEEATVLDIHNQAAQDKESTILPKDTVGAGDKQNLNEAETEPQSLSWNVLKSKKRGDRSEAPDLKQAKRRKWSILLLAIGLMVCLSILGVPRVQQDAQYQQAMRLFHEENYISAEERFNALGEYKDSSEMSMECRYQQALKLLNDGDWESAKAKLQTLGSYSDAQSLIPQCEYLHAEALLDAEEYEAAKAIFTELRDYSDASDRIKECDYRQAMALLDSGAYEEAKKGFLALGNYSNSVQMVSECKYQIAVSMLNAGDYKSAKAYFKQLGQYADSPELVKECDYNTAYALLKDEDYEAAKAIFSELGDYSDSDRQAMRCDYQIAQRYIDAGDYEVACDILVEIPSYEGAVTLAKHCYLLTVRDFLIQNRIVELTDYLFRHRNVFIFNYFYFDDCDVGLRQSKGHAEGSEGIFYDYYIDHYIASGVRDNNTYTNSVLMITLNEDGTLVYFGVYDFTGYSRASINTFNWDQTIQRLGYV